MNIIQVCFSLKNNANLDNIRTKMIELSTKLNNLYGDDWEVRSCHLSHTICKNKGFTEDVPNMFDEIFGNHYICELTESTFDEAMKNIHTHRVELSKKATNLVILSDETLTNVALELELFTQNRVIIL